MFSLPQKMSCEIIKKRPQKEIYYTCENPGTASIFQNKKLNTKVLLNLDIYIFVFRDFY